MFILLFSLSFAATGFPPSLVPCRLDGTADAPRMAVAAAWLLLCPPALQAIATARGLYSLLMIDEIAPVLSLSADAASIDSRLLRIGAMQPVQLLVVGLPLSVAPDGEVAVGLFPGIDLAEAALTVAVLAPTDAARPKGVVTELSSPDHHSPGA
ncbi:MAG: hypothetical protein GXY82_10395 [Methanospirillum sp.]|nr:hypothetical protein [Methanospirillum sp.]